jgi:hypothetical protein
MRAGFAQVKDQRVGVVKIALADALMAGFALFSLKDPSLLAFDQRRAKDGNLKRIYGMAEIPSDTQMRSILDEVDPVALQPLFVEVFQALENEGILKQFVFMEGCYLLALDGTKYFSSKKVHCPSCLERKSRAGEVVYSHQLLGGAIVHPERKEVIPLAPEPIIKQDGATKNDCERNAAKRFFERLRQEHPHVGLIVIEDALSSNAPHIRELQRHHLHYILGVKPGDHAFLFQRVAEARLAGLTTEYQLERAGVTHRFSFINQIPLNESNQDILVNFLEYWEMTADQTQHFSWVTDFLITRENVFRIMQGGRARWKVENETFNTLKNQGYHVEHNFGHGETNLSVVFATLMMLAFLVDQVQQLGCELFQAVLAKEGSKKSLWEHFRSLFYSLPFDSVEQLWQALLYGYGVERLVICYDTS